MSGETSAADCHLARDQVRAAFATGKTKSYNFRIGQLLAFQRMVQSEEKNIAEALAKDLGRCKFEAVGLEVLGLLSEVDHAIQNLKSWMEPAYTKVPAVMAPCTSEVVHEPYGVALVIGAFNYPIMLTLSPLLGAIMAGNAAIVKPSEIALACEKLLVRIIPQYLDVECYKVITGGIPTNTTLLGMKWDKIFFTGSIRVGKIVAAAAAVHLTPVSLELGGKSPVYIDESVTDLQLAVQRIMWGKFANAGQTCIAPDYVLCHEKHYDEFLKLAVETVKKFYGEEPRASKDFCRIISKMHTERLDVMMKDSPGRIVLGGTVDVENRYVEPTIVAEARLDSKLMGDEIFGPVLPVIKVKDIKSSIEIIKTMEKPLALYIFSKDQAGIDLLTHTVTSGGCLVNDCLYQFGNNFAPFGGVGPSGVGSYHGKYSFDCFSHHRTIMRRDDHMLFDAPIRYPPYTENGLKIFKFAALKLPPLPSITSKMVTMGVVAVAAVVTAAVFAVEYKDQIF